MLEVLIAAIVLLIVAFAGLGIKLIFDKKAEFTGGSCQATHASEEMGARGISCGCGSSCEDTLVKES